MFGSCSTPNHHLDRCRKGFVTLYGVTRPCINNDSTCGSVITRCVWFKALTIDTQIARLFYGGMGCLLWVYRVSYGTIFSLSCCMQCRIILNRVKMGPGRITNEHSHKQWNILSTCNCYLGKYHNDVIKWELFRDTGTLCGGFTGHRWIPLTKSSDAELWCFLWSMPE